MIAEGIAHAYGTHKQATRDKIAIIASSSICLSFSFKKCNFFESPYFRIYSLTFSNNYIAAYKKFISSLIIYFI
jgi:hypothetical protein